MQWKLCKQLQAKVTFIVVVDNLQWNWTTLLLVARWTAAFLLVCTSFARAQLWGPLLLIATWKPTEGAGRWLRLSMRTTSTGSAQPGINGAARTVPTRETNLVGVIVKESVGGWLICKAIARTEPSGAEPGVHYMLFVIYWMFVIRKLAKNNFITVHAPKITINRQYPFGNSNKKSTTIECSLLVITNYLLFVIRLFSITCSYYANTEHPTTKSFLENISNCINHSLTLFLSVLTQNFIFDQYKKLRKSKYRYFFIVLYICNVLDKKLIDLFAKTMLVVVCYNKNFTK